MSNLTKNVTEKSAVARADRRVTQGIVQSVNLVTHEAMLDVGHKDTQGNPVYLSVPYQPQSPPQVGYTASIAYASNSPHSGMIVSSQLGGTGPGTVLQVAGAVASVQATVDNVPQTGAIILDNDPGLAWSRTGATFKISPSYFASTPTAIAATAAAGSANNLARGDHTHAGVHKINGGADALGDIVFAGAGVSQAGNTFTFGGGGSGGGSSSSAYGSRPAAGTAGLLFLPSDGFDIERDNGTAWVGWGPLFPLTLVNLAAWAWVNQGGASVDTTHGGAFLSGPATATDSLRILKKSAPSTPYTLTVGFIPLVPPLASATGGILFRDGASGKITAFGLQYGAGAYNFVVYKFTNETTFSAAYTLTTGGTTGNVTFFRSALMFYQMADDGTNLHFRIGNDGVNFLEIFAVARTNFTTPTEIGFFVNAVQTTFPVGINVLSWKES